MPDIEVVVALGFSDFGHPLRNPVECGIGLNERERTAAFPIEVHVQQDGEDDITYDATLCMHVTEDGLFDSASIEKLDELERN